MIETSEQLYQAVEQMGRMQRILESYRNEILAKNPRNFALVAEGPLEQLRQLQKQIDEYIQGVGSWWNTSRRLTVRDSRRSTRLSK
jgi:hypothetical protein